MLRVEIRKYIAAPLFWMLNAIGVVLLAFQSFILFGAHQVGLHNLTAFDYLLGSMNFYLTYLLPFLYPLFVAYTYTSELQWRTLMFPIFDGVPRWKFAAGKAALAGVTVLVFTVFPLLLEIAIARVGFSAETLFLIAREALANAARHSDASKVDVVLKKSDGLVNLRVIDNGLGFDPTCAEGKGMGLNSMRERASNLGGSLVLESAPGRGTQVTAWIPLTRWSENGPTH